MISINALKAACRAVLNSLVVCLALAVAVIAMTGVAASWPTAPHALARTPMPRLQP